MRSLILTAAFGALTFANPVPQDIDLDLVAAAPDPTYSEAIGVTAQVVTYDVPTIVAAATSVTSVTVQSVPAADATDDAAARLAKRGNCATQPAGATGAPTVSTDTPAAFTSNAAFASLASSAPVPTGYDQAFVNLGGSNNAYGYMGYTTLQTYDSQACATKCDKMAGCMAVNIYFERDPSLDPGASCPDPSSVTMIKCVFWGGPVNTGNANNVGQYRQNFQVVIAGSNGYVNKSIATPAGYSGPVYLGNAAINAPYDSQGYNTYMGSKIFTSGPFNASLCADYCTAQTVYNLAYPATDGSPVQTCQFFNTYLLYINQTSKSQGQYCAIYSEAWSSSYATNTGQYRGNDHYMIYNSFSFTNSTGMVSPNKNGAIHQASKDITYSSLQTYCSTILGYSLPVATVTATTTITPLGTTTATLYNTATVTASPAAKLRRDDASTSLVTLLGTTAYPDRMLPTAAAAKRALSTPDVLTKYPATVVSSACSLVATPVTSTSTTTISQTATAPTSFLTATISADVTVTVTPSATATTCAASPVFTYSSDPHTHVGCSYQESCGALTDAVSCAYTQGKKSSASDCASSCDFFLDCGGANFYDSGLCILCESRGYKGSRSGDGSSVVVALVRQQGSCADSGGDYF